MIIESHSVEETLRIGQRLGELASRSSSVVCIALDGPLGAGKTHLTRGIAQGAGVADLSLVCSPTYVLLNIYEAGEGGEGEESGGRGGSRGRRVYHFDAYRVGGSQEFEELGFEEILAGPAIVVVEWASRVADLMPADTLWITIEHGDEGCRTLDITGGGHLFLQLAPLFTA